MIAVLGPNEARSPRPGLGDHLRAHFRESRVTAVNLMGSPGAGKTALLETTAGLLGGRRRLAAISGDLATTHPCFATQIWSC